MSCENRMTPLIIDSYYSRRKNEKKNSFAVNVAIGFAMLLPACQMVLADEITFEKKIEKAIKTSPEATKERLELLRSKGSPDEKSKFLTQEVFKYPHKLEKEYLESKGADRKLIELARKCPRVCKVILCPKIPHSSDCGHISCEPPDDCAFPCKPKTAC